MICPACSAENNDDADNCIQCGKGLFALTAGAFLASRYEILSLLGRGGMGIVYKARDHALDESVAVKVLRFDLARADDVARRFRSEIKLARKVRHRNVCGIHEYGQDGVYRFIVMELIEGQDLRRILRERGAFPPEEACSLAIEITEGLQAIHDVGIVHRDLKTPNIMLDGHGRVRLMDFGIAKQYGADVTAGSATGTGLVLGTPEYMSPEQARGQKIDFRSDVYALGIVVYELFTGRVPFRGDTPLATIFKHLQENPVFDGPEGPGIPAPVIPVLRKALAKSPLDRYASAREMAQALRQARAEAFGVPVETATTPIPPATAPDTRRLPETLTLPTPTPPRPPAPPPKAPPTRTVATGRTVVASSGRRRAAGARRTPWVLASAAAAGVAAILLLRSGGLLPGSSEPAGPSPSGVSPSLDVSPPRLETPPSPSSEPQAAIGSAEVPSRGRPSPSPPQTPESTTSIPAERRPLPADRPAAPAAPKADAPTPVSRPTPRPTPTPPPATPTPLPPPPARATLATGLLQLRILPWAEVAVDGRAVGTTPLRPVSLPVGEHKVVLSHPDYKPLLKTVRVRADETTMLEIDLSYEAFPR